MLASAAAPHTPDMLISAQDLLARLDDPGLRIADVRWYLADPAQGRREYAQAHLPGAVFVDVDSDLVGADGPGRHPLPSPRAFAARLGALGIGPAHEVVAYDASGGTIAARLWWMLDAIGHRRVALLDGGLPAWVAQGGPVTDVVPRHPPVAYDVELDAWPGTIDRDALVARLGDLTLLDVRAAERYRGEIEPIDPVAGHIPTALSAPTTANVGPDGRFLGPSELAERFAALGAAGGPGTAVHCGSGINATHTVLAMRLAGLPAPLLYEGSYSDWSRAGMPVVTGADPGSAAPVRPAGEPNRA